MSDIRELHRRALTTAQSVVDQVDPDRLDLPTPCSAWTLGRLLAHMTGQNHGFAASARGESEDLSIWEDRQVDADPAGVFAASAADVTAAFAADLTLERTLWLPEIHPRFRFPAAQAIGFHYIDTVVHAWDVAAAIGAPLAFDQDLLDAALPIAEFVPDGESRLAPGAAFRPAIASGSEPGGPTLDRILALLGRSPQWSA
ncbi:TIGR03086 family metal-binding protein [Streptacidiphilus cavernicola]|uniref:TIGR03086 family metal-binding protein n=1 Tax=Streptacidiphilus cavernicola TaxID=3342716 RepID=A0ABV6W650_9ACTN